MIAVWSRRHNITNILLEGEHIDLDIQENVRNAVQKLVKIVFLLADNWMVSSPSLR